MELSLDEVRSRFQFSQPEVYLYKTKYVQVRVASDLQDGSRVAIKECICPIEEADPFRSECKNQSKVRHPYINKPIGCYYKPNRSQAMVGIITKLRIGDWEMEIEKRRKAGNPFSEAELIEYLRMLTSALEHCQRMKIAHRDVKPSNIFASGKGKLKLGDFGSSREIKDGESLSIRGTVYYLSPLLRRNLMASPKLHYDPFKSDVYSLGISMVQAAQLLQCRDLQGFCTFDNLQEFISTEIGKLHYSDEFKGVLSAMLKVEEDERPDCIETAEIVRRQWPNGMCSNCGIRAAEKSCICSFPPAIICNACISLHLRGTEHHLLMVAESNLFDTQEKVLEGRQALSSLRQVFEVLNAQEQHIIALTKKANEYFDRFISEVNQERAKLLKTISGLNAEISSLHSSLLYLRSSQAIKEKALLDHLASHFPLYINIQHAKQVVNSVPIVENVSTLVRVWKKEYMKVMPLLENRRVRLQPVEFCKQWVDRALSREICMSKETSLALIDSNQLFVCGSQANPNQALIVSLCSGEVSELPNLLYPRLNPSVTAVNASVYIFGGFKLTTAEVYNIASITREEIARMTYQHYRCSSCHDTGQIYIPGTHIEVYSVQNNSYAELPLLSEECSYMMSVMHSNCLYIFTDQGLYYRCLRENQRWNAKQLLNVPFYSQMSLQVINSKVYFIGEGEVLGVDLKNFTKFTLTR